MPFETTPGPDDDVDLLGDSDDVDHSIEQRIDEQLEEEQAEDEAAPE